LSWCGALTRTLATPFSTCSMLPPPLCVERKPSAHSSPLSFALSRAIAASSS
jgi:hypothetical protein